MKIDKENYGRLIVDYYDGQLSPKEEQLLMHFLDQHPMLKKEFVNFEVVPVLPKESLGFSGKQALKKSEIVVFGDITEDNYTEFFVLSLDGELTVEVQQSLEIFLQRNPHLQGEYRKFELTKVAPDESIVFVRKQLLHKHRTVPLMRYAGLAVAAVLLLFFSIRFFLSTPRQKMESKQLAVESVPLKTMEVTITDISPRLIRKKVSGRINKPKAVTKNIPVTILKPVEMLASANIYMPLKIEKDYASLLFPKSRAQEETLASSSPVVVDKPKRNNFLRHTIGKPFLQLAAVLALQRKKRKADGVHDKGFVKILQRGVDVVNALTDNDMVMVKTYDVNGNLIDYQLLSDNFSINRPVREEPNR